MRRGWRDGGLGEKGGLGSTKWLLPVASCVDAQAGGPAVPWGKRPIVLACRLPLPGACFIFSAWRLLDCRPALAPAPPALLWQDDAGPHYRLAGRRPTRHALAGHQRELHMHWQRHAPHA